MKNRLLRGALAGFLALLPAAMLAQTADQTDKTLSPYFVVQGEEGMDGLPLKSTNAQVHIAGVISDVQVTQVYENKGSKPLEAVYVFPASTQAAVYGMKMTIGDRTIVADIKKRDEARKTYEQAKNAGQNASLLEEQRSNVFQMNVANIMPGDVVKVELKYTELLTPTSGVYEFVYPTVVGPRYAKGGSNPQAAGENSWTHNPYLHSGETTSNTFDITVDLSAGLPIQDVQCPSHKTSVAYDGKSMATVKLDPSESQGGNRDFVLKYKLEGSQVQTGLLLYKGDKENYFVIMAQPPKRVVSKEIPSRDYIFIVDVSGSMYGFPLETSKKLIKNLLTHLRSTDSFNIIFFSGGDQTLSPTPLMATKSNIQKAIQMLENQDGGGGTELLPALQHAFNLPGRENASRTVVIATDGYVDVEPQAFDLIKKNLGQANFFAFGIGTAVNRHLIEGMARVGMGEPFVVEKPEAASAKADEFRKMIDSPVLTGVKINFGGMKVYDVEPASVPDVFTERPLVVFGKYRGEPKGLMVLSGHTGEGPYESKIDLASTAPMTENSALRYLWARHRIATLGDYNFLSASDERVKAITQLGLDYNLLTEYTSFVAVDSLKRNKGEKSTTVNQPLPLPQGVSDLAVGGNYAAAPSPAYAPSTSYDYAPGAGNGAIYNSPMAEALPPSGNYETAKEYEPKEKAVGHFGGVLGKKVPTLHSPETDNGGPSLTWSGLTFTSFLTEADFKTWFENNRSALEASLSGCASFNATLKVKVDGQGNVVLVNFVGPDPNCAEGTKNLVKTLQAMTFPAPGDGKGCEIEFTLAK